MTTYRKARLACAALMASSIGLTSCALQEKGPQMDPFAAINPMQKFNPLAPQSPLAASVVTQWEKDFAQPGYLDSAAGHWHTRQGRDELVYRLILMSDYRFSRYEADLVAGKATRDSFVDLAVLGLTSAATFLQPGEATRILSAISGGLIGSRATIEKNFYQNQAQPVLLRKMKVLRQQKLFAISHRLRKYDTNVYPTERALIDVLDYYNRGTMLSALQEISNDTAAQEIELHGGKVLRPSPAATADELPPLTIHRETETSTTSKESASSFKADHSISKDDQSFEPKTPEKKTDSPISTSRSLETAEPVKKADGSISSSARSLEAATPSRGVEAMPRKRGDKDIDAATKSLDGSH